MEFLGSVWNFLSYFVYLIIALGILVFVHELGHFLAARLFKMRVEQFSIGFPPRIFGKKVGDTDYRVGAIPLGGYVKITGMIDETMDSSFVDREPEPWEFRSKPVWQRIIVICAGVFFNLVLAWMVFIGLKLAYGETRIPADKIDHLYVADGSLAYDMGLRSGDKVFEVNGTRVEYFDDMVSMQAIMSDRMIIKAKRNGETVTITGPENLLTQLNRAGEAGLGISIIPSLIGGTLEDTPANAAGMLEGDRIVALNGQEIGTWGELTDIVRASEGAALAVRWLRSDGSSEQAFEEELTPKEYEGRFVLGIDPPSVAQIREEFGVVNINYTIPEAIVGGLTDTWTRTAAVVQGFRKIFVGKESIRENLGGPVLIARETKRAADRGPQDFWFIVAMLSITLAFINILPIPALDGGHLVFLIYEGVTRRRPPLRFRMVVQQIGMLFILVLMVFVIFNDILRW